MAEETKVIKYVDLEGLSVYDKLIKGKISEEDAKSLKTVILDGTKLKFYRAEEPITEGATAAYEIDLPQQDLSSLMRKLVGSTKDNLVVATGDGGVEDSGVAIGDIATQTYVNDKVAEEIGKTQHIVSQVVTELPSDEDAKVNVIYLIKDANAKGDDVYKEYLVIDGVLTCIGDTTTDLSNVYTKEEVDGKIATAKSEAISEATSTAAADATSKADQALTDAKAYTDQEVAKDRERLDSAESDIDTAQSDIETLQASAKQHDDKIAAIEKELDTFSIASADEITAMFNGTTETEE